MEAAARDLETELEAGTLTGAGPPLLARLYMGLRQDEKAVALLESLITQYPGRPGLKNDLAFLIAWRGGDLDRALELAQEARAALPRSAPVADTLGYVYLRRELPEAALPQLEEAVALAEPDSPEWSTAQYHRALALRALGLDSEAVQALENALDAGEFLEQPEAQAALDELKAASSAQG